MARILVEFEKTDSTTELAKKSYKRIFDYVGVDSVFKTVYEISADDLSSCDLYWAIRPTSMRSLSIARAVKESGKFYIVDYDDDLLNLPSILTWRKKNAYKCITIADVVLGVNPCLVDEYAKIAEKHRGIVLNTPVLKNELLDPFVPKAKINFVYAAGRDHELFFEQLFFPILGTLLEKYHNEVHFTFIGVKPNLKKIGYQECFSFIDLMPLDKYNEYMATHRFNVGLAPLEDTNFNNHKYFNKFIEYSKLGMLGLFSNCKPYTYAVNNNNGYLIDNIPELWFMCMENLINSRETIYEKSIIAQKYLYDNFSIESISSCLSEQLPEIFDYISEKQVTWHPARFLDVCFNLFDKSKKLSVQYKSRGLKGVATLARNHIQDKLRRRSK